MPRRRLIRWLPLAILITAVVEIAVFVLVAHLIGFGYTVLLVLATSAAGALLLRREGMRAWRRFRAAVDAGRPPGEEVTDGLVGLGAGVLMAIPGLVSAAVGVLLALPPGRQLARIGARRAAERRISSATAGDLFGPRRVRVRRGTPQPHRTPGGPPVGPTDPSWGPTSGPAGSSAGGPGGGAASGPAGGTGSGPGSPGFASGTGRGPAAAGSPSGGPTVTGPAEPGPTRVRAEPTPPKPSPVIDGEVIEGEIVEPGPRR